MRFKYLVLSDIHLGHNINKTHDIVNNLVEFFNTNSRDFKDLDMLCIAGDIFDRLLTNSSIDYIESMNWLTNLVMWCKDNNVMLRVLEGTPSHDWQQAKLLSKILDNLQIEIDYKYVNTLLIEKVNKFGINILYIPDEYKHDAKETYDEVLKLLKKHKLNQVDIAFIHGQFHYQLPMVKLISSHTEDDYLNIVKYYISVGHIHTASIYDRILAQGSFDRLAHGEEEDKGGMLITLDTEKGNSFKFLVNKKAMIFKTLKFTDETIDTIVKKIQKISKTYPDKSNIRVISESEAILSKHQNTLKLNFPNLNIKIEKPKKKEEEYKYKLLEQDIVIDSFSITKDNIEELVLEELGNYPLSSDELCICQSVLAEILKEEEEYG